MIAFSALEVEISEELSGVAPRFDFVDSELVCVDMDDETVDDVSSTVVFAVVSGVSDVSIEICSDSDRG